MYWTFSFLLLYTGKNEERWGLTAFRFYVVGPSEASCSGIFFTFMEYACFLKKKLMSCTLFAPAVAPLAACSSFCDDLLLYLHLLHLHSPI